MLIDDRHSSSTSYQKPNDAEQLADLRNVPTSNENYSLESPLEHENLNTNTQNIFQKIRKAFSYRRLRETAINEENDHWAEPNDLQPHSSTKDYMNKVYDKVRIRTPYYIPILSWLPQYRWCRDFPSDLVAGLGVASLLIPQCLAYAFLATLPPQVGLYASFVPLLVYALFGTSKQLSIGPDALGSLMVALLIAARNSNSNLPPVDAALLGHLFAFIVGLFLLILGLLRIGFLDNVISRPLLGGFVNAVAFTIVMEQWDTLFGLPPNTDHSWHKILYVISKINLLHWPTLVVGLAALSFLFAVRLCKKFLGHRRALRWIKFVPETMVVVVCGIIVSVTLRLSERGVRILGNIPRGFPIPDIPFIDFPTLQENLVGAITIAIVGFVESIIVAKMYGMRHNYPVSPNRELVALGFANLIGAFFGSYPVFGSLTRSSLADMMGARSQIFGVVTASLVLLTMLWLSQLFYYLPKVIMSSIVLVAACGLVEYEDLLFMIRIKAWKDIFLFVLTFLLTVVLGIDLGIFISLGVSVFLVIKHTSAPHITVLGRINNGKYRDISLFPDAQALPGVLIIRIEEALYFANMTQVKELFGRIERLGSRYAHPAEKGKNIPPLRALVLHVSHISDMDASATRILAEMVQKYRERHVFVAFVKLREHLKALFVRAGIIDSTEGDRLFNSTNEAVTYIEKYILEPKKQ